MFQFLSTVTYQEYGWNSSTRRFKFDVLLIYNVRIIVNICQMQFKFTCGHLDKKSSTDSDPWLRPLWNPKLKLRLKRKMAAGWMKFNKTGTCKAHSYDLIFK